MRVLEDLWFGNIEPIAIRSLIHRPSIRKLMRLAQSWTASYRQDFNIRLHREYLHGERIADFNIAVRE